jgi:hypothetical protein
MEFKDMSACAMQELANISEDKDALDSLTKFCLHNLGEARPKWGISLARKGSLFAFYIFSGAVSHDGSAAAYKTQSYCGRRYNDLYAKEFADLLRENKLGEVWESPVIKNTVFHPDHANQMYVWMPDIEALNAWWKAQPQPKKVRPQLYGTWEIGILPECPNMDLVCSGPTLDNHVYGCGVKFYAGDVVWKLAKVVGIQSYGGILCRECAVITDEEVASAKPFPPVKQPAKAQSLTKVAPRELVQRDQSTLSIIWADS